ncbi:MAG: sulfite exporter TauE/SafE family protein [Planctomycetota bacterium]|nr:sulfite exporter TauE/SafE family protein [Planctomycetota bacterium]
MPESYFGWLLLAIAAFGIGITKSGFSGVSMVHVILFAHVFGARESTGIVLPMLIAGDIFAMTVYGKHANWKYVRRMFGPAMIGVVAGWLLMFRLDENYYRPLIGTIILGLTVLQIIRIWKEEWLADVPHARWFAWSMGILVGLTTMLANAAGPVFGLFLLAIGLPKMEFVGTAAWFFLLLNISKIPFSWSLGLIRLDTLALNAALMPLIGLGLWVGTMVVRRIPQKLFDSLILIFTGVAALRMLFL